MQPPTSRPSSKLEAFVNHSPSLDSVYTHLYHRVVIAAKVLVPDAWASSAPKWRGVAVCGCGCIIHTDPQRLQVNDHPHDGTCLSSGAHAWGSSSKGDEDHWVSILCRRGARDVEWETFLQYPAQVIKGVLYNGAGVCAHEVISGQLPRVYADPEEVLLQEQQLHHAGVIWAGLLELQGEGVGCWVILVTDDLGQSRPVGRRRKEIFGSDEGVVVNLSHSILQKMDTAGTGVSIYLCTSDALLDVR